MKKKEMIGARAAIVALLIVAILSACSPAATTVARRSRPSSWRAAEAARRAGSARAARPAPGAATKKPRTMPSVIIRRWGRTRATVRQNAARAGSLAERAGPGVAESAGLAAELPGKWSSMWGESCHRGGQKRARGPLKTREASQP